MPRHIYIHKDLVFTMQCHHKYMQKFAACDANAMYVVAAVFREARDLAGDAFNKDYYFLLRYWNFAGVDYSTVNPDNVFIEVG